MLLEVPVFTMYRYEELRPDQIVYQLQFFLAWPDTCTSASVLYDVAPFEQFIDDPNMDFSLPGMGDAEMMIRSLGSISTFCVH